MITFTEIQIQTSGHIEIPVDLELDLSGSTKRGAEQVNRHDESVKETQGPQSNDLIYLNSAAQAMSCLSLGYNPVTGEKLKEGAWSQIPVAQKMLDVICDLLSSQGVDVPACLNNAKLMIQENTVEVEQAPKAKRWNRVEDELLIEQVGAGLSCFDIAKAHERDCDSIEQRVKKLNLQWPVKALEVSQTVAVQLPVVPSAKNLDLFDELISPSVARSESIAPQRQDLLDKIPEDFIENLAVENQKTLETLEDQWKSN